MTTIDLEVAVCQASINVQLIGHIQLGNRKDRRFRVLLNFESTESWVLDKESVENCHESTFVCPNATQHTFYNNGGNSNDNAVVIVRDSISRRTTSLIE